MIEMPYLLFIVIMIVHRIDDDVANEKRIFSAPAAPQRASKTGHFGVPDCKLRSLNDSVHVGSAKRHSTVQPISMRDVNSFVRCIVAGAPSCMYEPRSRSNSFLQALLSAFAERSRVRTLCQHLCFHGLP